MLADNDAVAASQKLMANVPESMHIPITQSANPKRLRLLELQGSLALSSESVPLRLCELHDTTLYIGNHRLEGKVTALKKPLVVIRRGKGLEVQCVVREKIVFAGRPEHIVSDANRAAFAK